MPNTPANNNNQYSTNIQAQRPTTQRTAHKRRKEVVIFIKTTTKQKDVRMFFVISNALVISCLCVFLGLNFDKKGGFFSFDGVKFDIRGGYLMF